MHTVRKESSSTTKIRAVLDASAKSTTGTLLNDTLLVGPTVHPLFVDVLLCFHFHQIALTTDLSRMYCAVEFIEKDKDLHCFVWRQYPDQPLQDFRMTQVMFWVSTSSFAANMSVKQNALDHALDYLLAANAVHRSGADSTDKMTELQRQLQDCLPNVDFCYINGIRVIPVYYATFPLSSEILSTSMQFLTLVSNPWHRMECYHRPFLLDCCWAPTHWRNH